jgi:tetratricopeptide (TPR) repeat protein
MFRGTSGRRFAGLGLILICLGLVTLPAAAQSSSMIRGRVVDAQGQPVEGAVVTIEFTESNRRMEAKTNRRGEYVQIGLGSGTYRVTVQKDKFQGQQTEVRVSVGQAADANFTLQPAGPVPPDPEKIAAIRKGFEEGVGLAKAGNHDGAIAKFNETIAAVPNCSDCYYNIGISYVSKKEYDQAEAAFKKAVELNPQHASAYNGLATVYNATKRPAEAEAASAKAVEIAGAAGAAGGGGSAEALYNQGVIFWNAGKIAEAKKQFEEVVKLDPNHAEAYYQLGMAFLNEGNTAEAVTNLEKSLSLAPTGPNAAQAKALIGQLKK